MTWKSKFQSMVVGTVALIGGITGFIMSEKALDHKYKAGWTSQNKSIATPDPTITSNISVDAPRPTSASMDGPR